LLLVWHVNWTDDGLIYINRKSNRRKNSINKLFTSLIRVLSERQSTVRVDEQSISPDRNTPNPFWIFVNHGLIICTEQLSFP
jgi:hypothetical protein